MQCFCIRHMHIGIALLLERATVQHVDAAQCGTVWKNRARKYGVEYDAAIDGYLAEFRAAASGQQHLSELEDMYSNFSHNRLMYSKKMVYCLA